jgi:glyoxylase-like metal-dependent hydrolase (beta-lactamase superfamily II)
MGGVWRSIAVALALTLGAATPASAQPSAAPPVPMVRPEGLRQVSPHVWVIPDNSTPLVPNIGFVVGSRGVLVIDTGLGERNGALVAAQAQKLAPGRKIYLVATHAHPEHDLGAAGFPATATVIRSTDQAGEAESDLRLASVFSGRSPAIAELLQGARFRPADVTFQGSHDLELGGVTARILALGPNHTPGDTGVWVPADRVLFSGDVAMRAQPLVMAAGASMAQWMASLDRLEALGPAVVVPSHGPLGDVGFIRGYRAYLTEVGERTAAAKAAGADLEGAVAAVQQAMGARYPDRNRLAGAVRMAYGATGTRP